MPIRLPVTMNRRWLQMTALGAADVPDVKMSPHSVSGSGSSPGSTAWTPARASSSGLPRLGSGSSPSAKRVETSRLSASEGRRPAIGSSSGTWRGSVTINPTCVCSMSCRRCSSRRV